MENAMNFLSTIPTNLLLSLVIIIITIVILVLLKHFFKRCIARMNENQGIGSRISRTFSLTHTIIRYSVIFVAVITLLGVNGIDIQAVATAAGAAGIVLAFALQDLLQDFAMGARIVTDSYFKVGDAVEINGVKGTIVAMTPQSTKIRNFSDDSITTISNRLLQTVSVLADYSDIDIGLPYELPAAEAERILTNACETMKEVEGITDAQFKGTNNFGDSAIEYKVRIFTDPATRLQLLRDARRVIQNTLEAEGISCPFPQLDVHTK